MASPRTFTARNSGTLTHSITHPRLALGIKKIRSNWLFSLDQNAISHTVNPNADYEQLYAFRTKVMNHMENAVLPTDIARPRGGIYHDLLPSCNELQFKTYP